jgi:hypothetical protein
MSQRATVAQADTHRAKQDHARRPCFYRPPRAHASNSAAAHRNASLLLSPPTSLRLRVTSLPAFRAACPRLTRPDELARCRPRDLAHARAGP